MNDSIVDDFVTLFRGRGDCYGAWDGGCVREPLTRDLFDRHLDGDHLIGVYPAFNHNNITVCVWGCSDIDYDNSDHAWAVHDALLAKHIASWVEKTRKGFHIWVFAHALTPAIDMRRMLLAAHQVADVPAKEINPKQETLGPSQVGNYVRLPYPGGLTERRVLHDENNDFQPMNLADFVRFAKAFRSDPHDIATLASYWRPPAAPTYMTSLPSLDMQQAAARLDRVGKAIFTYGPMPDRDRSTTLLRLAHRCAEAGLAIEDCLLLMEDADLRWGKFMTRPNGRNELIKLMTKAYGTAPGPNTSR